MTPSSNIRKLASVVTALLLASCDRPSLTAEPGADEKVARGEVALIATAPDGTRLWGIKPPGEARRVYFASSGTATRHSEACGKNCTRQVADVVSTAGQWSEPR